MKTLDTLKRFDPIFDSTGAQVGIVQQISRDRLILKFIGHERPYVYLLNADAHDRQLSSIAMPPAAMRRFGLSGDRLFFNAKRSAS